MSFGMKRLSSELHQIHREKFPGMAIVEEKLPAKVIMKVETNNESIYCGEAFTLEFRFKETYPYTPPIVKFIKTPIPVHPHIYSNGHICLSILDSDWTPAYSVWSVCLSILSMLNTCKEKVHPPDNEEYVKRAPSDPSKTRWAFHDDKV